MRKFIAFFVILLLVFLGLLAYSLLPTRTRASARDGASTPDAASIERGRYLAVAADCTACHTAPDGKDFAGGLAIASPVGTIYSTNITPDPKTGIGEYSLDDFDRALRHGIDKDGGTLYPAMPYPSYSLLSDDDVVSLYDYFLHGVDPVVAEEHENGIPWPLSIEWPVALWRKLFAPKPDAPLFNAAHYSDPVVARGAYLVQGAGHCGSCHTARAITLQEKALDESSSAYLAGGAPVDGWVPVNLRGNIADGLGSWSAADIVQTLKTGRNATHAVAGSAMNDVIVHSSQHMTDEDLLAIAAYLKTLAPVAGDAAQYAANTATAIALAAGHEADRGAELYDDNCAACHRTSGEGSRNALPSVAGNPTVLSADPSTLINLVLAGSSLPGTATAPSALGMPGFAWRLSNAEVAALLTFIRSSWGNQAAGVSAAQVGKIRAALDDRAHPRTSASNQ